MRDGAGVGIFPFKEAIEVGWATLCTRTASWGAIGTRSTGSDLRVDVQALTTPLNLSSLHPLTSIPTLIENTKNECLASGTFINTILFNSNNIHMK